MIEKEKLFGIITESNFAAKEKSFPFFTFRATQVLGQWLGRENIERIYQAAKDTVAEKIMTRRVISVKEDDSVEKAVELVLSRDINRIAVVRDEKPVGIIARHDLLRLLTTENKEKFKERGT